MVREDEAASALLSIRFLNIHVSDLRHESMREPTVMPIIESYPT